MRWHYTTVASDNIHTISGIALDSYLDQMGNHGWELITVIPYYVSKEVEYYKYFFKKQVVQ